MAFKNYFDADRRSENEPPMDLSPFVGDWKNTKKDTHYFHRIVIAAAGDHLSIRPYTRPAGKELCWGEVTATPYTAGNLKAAIGFSATYDFGGVRTRMVANQKLGVLVIQSYTDFTDGSGRSNHFAREFFHR